jgi:hypothetical protein
MHEIQRGSRVIVRSADNKKLPRRAVSGIVNGDDFLVVWVCREEEWAAANAQERQADALPWPAEDVELAEMSGGDMSREASRRGGRPS